MLKFLWKITKKLIVIGGGILLVLGVIFFIWGFAWTGIPALCRGTQALGNWTAGQVAYYTGTESPSGPSAAEPTAVEAAASPIDFQKKAEEAKRQAKELDLSGRILGNKADHRTAEELDEIRILKGAAAPGDEIAVYLVDKDGGVVYQPYTVHVDGLTQEITPSSGHEGQPFPAIRDHTYKVWAQTSDGRRTAVTNAVLPTGMDHPPFYPLVLVGDPPIVAPPAAKKWFFF